MSEPKIPISSGHRLVLEDGATMAANVEIDSITCASVYLELYRQDMRLLRATGFVVIVEKRWFLITNWHVISGYKPGTLETMHPMAAIPDVVRIALHVDPKPGRWEFVHLPLRDENDAPLWIEHPMGSEVDVVALELRGIRKGLHVYALPLDLDKVDMQVPPGTPVSVVGYPNGLDPNFHFAIWKTGHIATDVGIPYKGLPAFLIDATTREGMSGSPVIARRWKNIPTMTNGMPRISPGMEFMPPLMVQVESELQSKFLGIYSGRVHERAEIGIVWKPIVVREILEKVSVVGA